MTTRGACFVLGLLGLWACDDGGGDAGAAVARKAQSCGVVTEGKLSVNVPDGELADCFVQCELDATCAEIEQAYCGAGPSDRVNACRADCLAPTDCADERGRYTVLERCDGRDDCADGSDELGCPAVANPPQFCEDDGARIPRLEHCNGRQFCDDGTDENGCPAQEPMFTCETRRFGITQQIPQSKVCNLLVDCVDGSDEGEAQGCARRACN